MNDLNGAWFALTNLSEEPRLRDHRDPLLRAFAEHLGIVASAVWALHKSVEGDAELDREAIRACLRPAGELKILTADAERLIAELERCKEGRQ